MMKKERASAREKGCSSRERSERRADAPRPLSRALRGRENSVLPLWAPTPPRNWLPARTGDSGRSPQTCTGQAPRRRATELGDGGRGAAERHVAPGGGLFSVLAGSDPHAAGPEGLRANGGKARHGHADAGPWGANAWPTAGRAQRFADVALPCAALVKVPTSLGCTGIPRWRGHLTGGLRAARLLVHAPTH